MKLPRPRWMQPPPEPPESKPEIVVDASISPSNDTETFGFCRTCGSPRIKGYIVLHRGYYSQTTGKKLENRVMGVVCTRINRSYRYDQDFSYHDGAHLANSSKSAYEVEL